MIRKPIAKRTLNRLTGYFPILDWGRRYDRQAASNDLLAAVIVTIMLIPQSLAYAMLAGLPPEVGLYASILPLVAYAIFGTSRTLAVGPVAVVSLMTASAVGQVAPAGEAGYLVAAAGLALLSGAILIVLGVLRLGFLANFLSRPVISGFITASGVLIAMGQVGHLMGIGGQGSTLPAIARSLYRNRDLVNLPTLLIGAGALAFLLFARRDLASLLKRLGLRAGLADLLRKAAPLVVVGVTITLSQGLDLQHAGVAVVGAIPQGLPSLALPAITLDLSRQLALPALLIAVVGFVESVSVAQTLAARHRGRIDPDQELIGLGAANLAAGFSSGYPVTGGFARSVVNDDAGARTPAAGAFTAVGIALAALFLTPLLSALPQAVLAATIILAVLALVDLRAIRRVYRYSRRDFAAMAATIIVTLGWGVEAGIVAGVGLSLLLHLHQSSRPHTAIVGRVPGTEHFRNVDRHHVQTDAHVLSIRVDESLYFANARFLEDRIAALVAARPDLRHVVLMCSAVNVIDASALESLAEINRRLTEAGIGFHLSEVKGPVMDRLGRSSLLEQLNGQIFLSQHEACCLLAGKAPDPGVIRAG